MGALRVLLAIAVVIYHSAPIHGYVITGGTVAVQAFYMISGFYIALILNERYQGTTGLKSFYINRFLRLMPMYWMVLIASVLLSLIFWADRGDPLLFSDWARWSGVVSIKTIIFGIFINLFVIFQELLLFMGLNSATGELHWTANFWAAPNQVWRFSLIPQAWSLSLEIFFYLLAPWIVRSMRATLLVCAASLGLRLWIYSLGLTGDPWHYRFFPNELFFFCVGALCYRAHVALSARKRIPLSWTYAAFVAAFVSTLFHHQIPLFHNDQTHWSYYAVIAASLPFLFAASRKSKLDNALGELSYPIYIVHFLVLTILQRSRADDLSYTIQTIVYSVLAAMILVRLARPFERMRSQRVQALGRGQGAKVREATPKKRARAVPV